MEFFGSIFHNNYARFSGGVLYVNDNSLRGSYQNRITIANSTFTNTTELEIEMEELYKCNIRYGIVIGVVINTSKRSFLRNRAEDYGGAIYYDGEEEVSTTNSTFTNSMLMIIMVELYTANHQ